MIYGVLMTKWGNSYFHYYSVQGVLIIILSSAKKKKKKTGEFLALTEYIQERIQVSNSSIECDFVTTQFI